MRTIFPILGICAALVMCAVSAVMNYLFMASLGKTPFEGQVLGAASAAADVLKALLPFFIAWSWAAGRMLAAVSGTLAFLFFAGFSLLSAIGFAADNRGTLVDDREGISHEYSRVHQSIRDAEIRRRSLPPHRPAAVVTEEIGALRQNRRWSATKECANATESESRAFCADYFRLRGELAAATEAERLSAQIASLQSETLKLRENGARQDSDPQVSLLSRITGREPEPLRLALIIAVALLVEIGASLGLFLASGHRVRTGPTPAALPAERLAGGVEEFCLEALSPSLLGSLSMPDIYRGYANWCREIDRAPLSEKMFAECFTSLASALDLPSDDFGYSGISLANGTHTLKRKTSP